MKKLIKGGWLYAYFPKISLKMKLTTLLLLVSLLQINASTYSQNKKITLEVKNASLSEIFDQIESASEFRFLFESNQIDLNRKVSLNVNKKNISYILELLFKETQVVYNTNNRQIILKVNNSKKNNSKPIKEDVIEVEQSLQIKGKVTDSNNVPLPGVNILVKGTSIGTQTDFDGNYNIQVENPNATLVFSYIGFVTQEVAIANRTSINVNLAEDVAKLDEVVVVGYGSQKQKDVTGSVSSMKSEDFNKGPQLSAQQAMQGKMAGVVIAQNSGKPGGSNTVRVRGGTSLTGVNDPLYVIDGVPISTTAGVGSANIRGNGTDFFDQEPTNPLMTINPNDIESITVLKDASSTAIYGSRGANGVIVITTKKGSSGNLKVTLDVTGGISTVAKKLDVLSADEYRKINTDLGLTFSDLGANTNWQDQIYRTAQTQDYNMSFSGGLGKSSYRASLGLWRPRGCTRWFKIRKSKY